MKLISLELFASVEEAGSRTFDILSETKGAAALSFGSTYRSIFRIWDRIAGAEGVNGPGTRENNSSGRLAGEKEPGGGQTGDKQYSVSQTEESQPGATRLPALFPADERLVPRQCPDSNWGSTWRLFSDSFGSEEDRQRWPRDIETFHRILMTHFGPDIHGDHLPIFNLIFLGLGSDGHTASLFPGSCPAPGSPRWRTPVLETISPLPPEGRLTLGPELIAHSRRLVLVVTGEEKAEIFRTLTERLYIGPSPTNPGQTNHGQSSPTQTGPARGLPARELPGESNADRGLPSLLILRRRRELQLPTEIIADEAAASRLSPEVVKEWQR